MTEPQTPGDRLRMARHHAGYATAKSAAEAMNLAVSTYLGHENGSRGIPIASVRRYADFFGVAADWIVFGKSLSRSPLMSAKQLNGQHVLVVGASSGMGRAVAMHAAGAGARLTLMGRDAGRLEPVASEIGGAEIREIDLRREETVPVAVEGIADVGHLVVTAGTYGVALVADSEPDDWRGIIEERLIGPLFLIKSLGRRLIRSITLFTGSTVRRPSAGAVLPTAALGGVEAMVRALAVELAPLRANAIAPGIVDTPLLDTVLGESKKDVIQASAESLPARHVGTPDDAASAALFLMTNPFITGTTIELDGGGTLV